MYFKELKLIVVLRSTIFTLEQTGPLFSHYSAVDWAGPLRGTNFTFWVHMRNFSPVSEMRKGRRRFVARNSRNKLSKHGETQSYKFRPIITLATLVAVSLMSNGMLMMWKIQQGKQDDAEFIRNINPAFLPVTGLKCSYGKISSPLSEIREPSLLAL